MSREVSDRVSGCTSEAASGGMSGHMPGHTNWSRRRFLREAALAGGALAVGPSLALPSSLFGPGAAFALAGPAVLSFHLDQPYLDLTGEARVYRPPAGARGGAPIAALSDAELSRYYGVI